MIQSFTIQNFKSILDLTLDFTYDEGKAPNGYEEMETLPFLELGKVKSKYIRMVPCIALYGANAAGKSNIIDALLIMKQVIWNGVADNYKPNKLNKKYDATAFIIEIYIEKKLYKYELQYNDKAILKEILTADNKEIYSIENGQLNAEKITTRTYNAKKLTEIYEVECGNSEKIQQKTFLNIIAKNYSGLNTYIVNFAEYTQINIQILKQTAFPIGLALQLLENHCGKDKQEAFKDIVDILKKFDFDIVNMSFEEKLISENAEVAINSIQNTGGEFSIRDNKLYINKIYSYHKDINNNEVEFNFMEEESLGTNTLAGVLGPILVALHTGSVLCIDELERSIHPLVLREIIKMFKSKRYNKKNAQLIFTAHNTDILEDELLRMSEIAFASKKLDTGTIIHRASSYKQSKDIRNVTNFRKRYLQGEFSAIPFPYI